MTIGHRSGGDQLPAGLRRQDPRILHDFYYRLRRRTSRYLLNRYGRHHGPLFDDCFSEAFLILLRKVRRGDYPDDRLEAYAFGIVKNTFRDALRRAGRRREAPHPPEALPEGADASTPVYDSAAGWLEALDHPRLWQWFLGLSSRQQQLLDLRIQGYKLHEMAERTEMAHGTLRNMFPRLLREAAAAVRG